MKKDDLIVIAGAGGFIAGALTRRFKEKGFTNIRAVDIKPIDQWYQTVEGVESIADCDLQIKENCYKVCEGAVEIYNLAADMGGMGFIENNKAACMLSVLINTHLLQAAVEVGVERYFYASSACVYPAGLQEATDEVAVSTQLEKELGYPSVYKPASESEPASIVLVRRQALRCGRIKGGQLKTESKSMAGPVPLALSRSTS